MLLVNIAPRTIATVFLAAAAVMSAASPAAAQLRSETTTVRIMVTVPAVLWIVDATAVSRVMSGGHEIITTRVTVRGNVPHQLEVRSTTPQSGEVRVRNGHWAQLSGDRSITAAQTDMIGDTSHLVVCRTPAPRRSAAPGDAGCELTFALASVDPRFPARSESVVASR